MNGKHAFWAIHTLVMTGSLGRGHPHHRKGLLQLSAGIDLVKTS